MIVAERNSQSEEGPKEVTIQNVQYWCKHSKELKQTQRSKALKFVEFDCVQYVGFDEEFGHKHTFVCLPLNTKETVTFPLRTSDIVDYEEVFEQGIMDENKTHITLRKKPFLKNYNNSVYKIYKEGNTFICNCQGWTQADKREETRRADGCQCSHVLALYYCFKIKKFGRTQGSTEELEQPDGL